MVSSKFGFTNTTASESSFKLEKLGVTSSYALKEDEPESCVLSNNTTPIDQGELISYRSRQIDVVTSKQDNLYPPQVEKGALVGIRVDELLSLSDSDDATFRVDLPIVAEITMRAPMNKYIDENVVKEVLSRLMSAIVKQDGSTRLLDLMRSALKPTVD